MPLRVVLLLTLIVGCAAPPSAATVKYRGFSITLSAQNDAEQKAAIQRAIEEQIDIVHNVGLPPEMLSFFVGVPFEVVPADSIPRTSPGLYSARYKSVKITSRITKIGRRPVLLHELLHAYHHQRIPHGYQNREILSLYETAKTKPAFKARSHMMQNVKEYFACAGTAYLFGVTAQEPFTREKVRREQPEAHAFLQKLFGKSAGMYAGSLAPGNGPAEPEEAQDSTDEAGEIGAGDE